MQLRDVQKTFMDALPSEAGTALAALKDLRASADKTLDAVTTGNIPQAQVYLEHSFTAMMMAFHYLNLDIENVVLREQSRRKANRKSPQERVILVFSDHAELRVLGELRGTIPLYTEEDYTELRQIAQLFTCRIEHADHFQLNMFAELSQANSNPDSLAS